MQKQLVEAAGGSKSAVAALSALGLSVNDLGRLSPDAQFRLIAERLSQIRNPAQRAALAMEVFGKSGTQLLPLMSDGARGIRQLEAEARDLGLTMRAEDAEAATRLGDAFTALWKTVLSVARVVGSALAPLLTEVALGAARIVITIRKWIEQNKMLVVTVFKVLAGVVAVGAGLIALGGVITGLGTVLGVVVTAFGAIGTAVGIVGQVLAALLSPIGLVVAAFAGLAAYIVYASGLGGAALDGLAQSFAALKAAIGKAADERAATGMTDPTRLKKLQDSLADSGALLGDEQRKIDTQGTFSALAARGLGADSLAERTAKATEQIVSSPVRSPRVAILLEPLADGAIGRGIVAGVTPVQIDVVRDTDLYAEPIAGTTTHMRSIPNGQTRILWKEAGTGVKWAVVRLSERARFAVFQLSGTWQAATSPEPDGWMKMTGCRPVFYFGSSHTYAADTSDATETIWHQAGYPPAQRSAVVALHKSTGRVPTRFGSGDWVWCLWNEYESRWQVLGDYEDHWRFVLSSSLTRCGSASAALVLYDGTKWCPQPLVFTVVDALGVVPATGVPAGKYGLAKHFADSGVWEVIALADGCCDPGSGGSGSGSGSCVTVVTKVVFDPITCRLSVCTRDICLPPGATISAEHCGGSGA